MSRIFVFSILPVATLFAALVSPIAAQSPNTATMLVDVTDQSGAVVEGSADTVTDVTDVWTFAREITSRDPNWKVVATEAGQ